MYESRTGQIKKLTQEEAAQVVQNRRVGKFYTVLSTGKYLAIRVKMNGTFEVYETDTIEKCKAWLRREYAA